MTIVAAADGSALGNPGPAGWAWYVDENCWRAGGWPHGTNNMGELMAVLDLFKSTAHLPDEPLKILCDSQYVINSVTKWMPGWKRKGWKKSDGKPVLNLELLKEIDAVLVGRKYTFEWVKGHAGHDLNEAADDRARAAATAYQAKREPEQGPGYPGAPIVDLASAGQTTATQTAAAQTTAAQTGTTGRPQAAQSPNAAPGRAAAAFREAALFDDLDEPDLFSLLEDEPDPAFTDIASLDAVTALERELLDPAVRSDPTRVGELLHPDFEEIGVSGRLWNRRDVLELMADEQAVGTELEVLSLKQVDAASALLCYRSFRAGTTALRSSLWMRENDQWRLRFHQGTREG